MIVKAPNPVLSAVARRCTYPEGMRIGKALTAGIAEAKANHKDNGMQVVGLAAPQIGISKKVFVAFDHVFINPVIVRKSDSTVQSKEGCLSLDDDLVVERERRDKVSLQWLDPNRMLRSGVFTGNAAVIVQHEMDHLSGKLCNE